MKRGADLDLTAVQDAEQRREPDRVLMLARVDVGIGPAFPPAHGARLDRRESREPAVPVASGVLEQRVGSFGLVAHNVPQGPATAGPGVAKVPGALVRVEAAPARRDRKSVV